MNDCAERPAIYAPNEPAPWEPAELPDWAIPLIERDGLTCVFVSALRGWGTDKRRVYSITLTGKGDRYGTDDPIWVGHWGEDPDRVAAEGIGKARQHLARYWPETA